MLAWPRWAAAGQAGEVGFGLVPGEGKRPGEEWVWAGLGREVGCGLGFVFFPFLFLFLFYFSLKLNYLNSKENLNSNPYEIKQ